MPSKFALKPIPDNSKVFEKPLVTPSTKLEIKLREFLKREPTEKEKGNVITDYIIIQQVLLDEQEALKIMGVNDVLEYSRVAAATILACEISLIASLAEGTLAKAHVKLARKGGAKSQVQK